MGGGIGPTNQEKNRGSRGIKTSIDRSYREMTFRAKKTLFEWEGFICLPPGEGSEQQRELTGTTCVKRQRAKGAPRRTAYIVNDHED